MRGLLPPDAVPWVPEHFYVECGAVLRRWDLNQILTGTEIAQAIDALMACTWLSPRTSAPISSPRTVDWQMRRTCRSGCGTCRSEPEPRY